MALTIMAVHAHPDDEATSTGGILARYASEGIRTVLVTCTDGACGDAPGGIKPDDPAFDKDAVIALRAKELAESCRILGISDFESLGYADSGMMGWSQNEAPDAFWNTPVDDAAARLVELMEKYRPDVVVTYDPNGFYGHPDHIQAHRITMAAAEKSEIPAKLYWTTVPKSRFAEFRQRVREAGGDWEEPEDGEMPDIGAEDDEIAAWVAVKDWAGQKFDALAAHASQSENIFFLKMGRDVFADLMGTETFIRVADSTGTALPEDDLFAGLR